MERLTARNDAGLAYLVKVKPDEQAVESSYPNTLKAILESFQQLAAYEVACATSDTECKSPEELASDLADLAAYRAKGKPEELERVKTGEWERMENAYGELEGFIHVECGFSGKCAFNHCPSCGYKMTGGERREKE